MRRLGLLAVLGLIGVVWVAWGAAGGAWGAVARPALSVDVDGAPTVFSPEHSASTTPSTADSYTLTVANNGGAATDGSPIVIADTLAPGLRATAIKAEEVEGIPLSCELATVTCVYERVLRPGETLRENITIEITPELVSKIGGSLLTGSLVPVANAASVSGGGAASVSSVASNLLGSAASSLAQAFGFQRFSAEVTGLDGLPDGQAGDHPYQFTVSFLLNSAYARGAGFKLGGNPAPAGGVDGIEGELKDIVTELPQGVVGDPQAVPQCPQYKVYEVVTSLIHACPADTQIGVATIYLSPKALNGKQTGTGRNLEEIQVSPIFNIQPDKGYPAEFALQASNVIVPIYATVDPEKHYAVRALVRNIPSAGGAVGVSATFFGTPAANANVNNPPRSSNAPVAFLDNPVDCAAGPQYSTVYADTWQHPGAVNQDGSLDVEGAGWTSIRALTFPAVTGCERLRFDPSLLVEPSTAQADESSALTVHLRVPQAAQEAEVLTTPPLKDVTVTLPAGLSISPSAADGLQACSDAQIELSSPNVGRCPLASQLGTVKATTPLLPASEPLEGEVFLGEPRCNPCNNADAADGNMLRMFLQIQGAGVVVKEEGHIYANTSTGQLTTTFSGLPELPVSEATLQFKGGLRAALATPQACGTFTTTSDLTPWSSPITPDGSPISQFNIDWTGTGGACPGSVPFSPSFSAGTSNPNAGQFSPLVVTFKREDREQNIAGIQVKTPPGLSGILTGIPLCTEPQASLGTCPQASRIGGMTVAAGAGQHPFYETGSLYLTGPYQGAPFGLSIVVPTVAGPFNLGNVVVRARVNIDPLNAALTVTSDPLPQVIDGIPLRLRTANVTVDRERFTFNPTSCAQMHIEATITGAQGATAHTTAPFAVSGCAGLHFAPVFKASTTAHASRADGASFDARLTVPPGTQSNLAKVKVELPKQLPSRLTTLQKACLAATFEKNPAGCPTGSLVGFANVNTPLLPVPLTGPAYFVSYGGAKFPELIIVLQGYGVRVDLHGETFISRKGITSSTFSNAPDVPFEKFELYLPQATNSALAANGNLCNENLAMPVSFTAQDGTQIKHTTSITVTGCPKTKTRNKGKKASTSSRAARHTKPGGTR